MRRFTVAAVLVAAALVARAPIAFACTCMVQPPSAHFEAAEAVFVGLVSTTDASPGAPTHVSFAVSEVFKGNIPEVFGLTTPSSGAECGIVFVPGERYAVFAQGSGDGSTTQVCDGTTKDVGVLDGREPVRRFDPLTGRASPPVQVRQPEGDDGARAGAIAAAATLLTIAAVWVWRARMRRNDAGRSAAPPG